MRKTDPAQFGGGRPHCKPYTQVGIERLLCSFAGCWRNAYAAWGACADDNIHRPMCPEHDYACNVAALAMSGDPDAEEKLVDYARGLQEDIGRELDLDVVREALHRVAAAAA